MKSLRLSLFVLLAAVVCGSPLRLSAVVVDGTEAPPAPPAAPAQPAPEEPPAPPSSTEAQGEKDRPEKRSDSLPGKRIHSSDVVFTVGDDAVVPDDLITGAALAIFGDVWVKGTARDVAMAIGGSNSIEGEVNDAAVAIFGNVKVKGHVHGDVVAILGGVELAPGATVGGQVVSILGGVVRGEGSSVQGQVINIGGRKQLPDWTGFHVWLREGALWGRLLTLDLRAAWAWYFAIGFFALYLLISLIAPGALARCAETLEARPGRTLLAMVLAAILIPLLMLILSFTVIGVPIVGLLVLALCLFGKASVLLALGRRLSLANPTLAVAAGGLFLTLLYLLPVVGILAFFLTGALGVGMVCSTVLLEWPQSRGAKTVPVSAPRPVPPPAPSAEAAGVVATDMSVSPDPVPAPAPAPEFSSATGQATVPPPIPPPPSSPDADTAPRAGFIIRFGASLIDAVIIGIVAGMAGGHFLLLLTAYCVVLWTLRGATIGGVICGLKVVRLDGKPVDWATSLIRSLGAFISFVSLGIGFLWVAIDDESQSWHDRIAGTTIIRHRNKKGLV